VESCKNYDRSSAPSSHVDSNNTWARSSRETLKAPTLLAQAKLPHPAGFTNLHGTMLAMWCELPAAGQLWFRLSK